MSTAALSEFDITLYHSHLTRSTRVKWTCLELGISHVTIKTVHLLKGEQYEEHFRAQNPMSAVPVLHLKHPASGRELMMTESGAIVSFLVEQAGKLQPGFDPLARAQYHRFCTFATASMDPLLWTIRQHEQVLPAAARVQHVADRAREEFACKVITTLESVLGNGSEWLCAPYCANFTAADLLVGYSLFWASFYRLLEKSDILKAYLGRVMNRKGFKDAFGDRRNVD